MEDLAQSDRLLLVFAEEFGHGYLEGLRTKLEVDEYSLEAHKAPPSVPTHKLLLDLEESSHHSLERLRQGESAIEPSA